ncbi:MAG: ribonuclease III [Clostridia bacterium]|nr:ribonuclease III [Clostridia bacterium]NCC43918.1 ribonuclease III [Clostridia bacterium]
MDKIKTLEQRISYTFQNKELLKTALCHSSYANEHRMDRLACNERLEFLGDAVLELVSSEHLFHLFPKLPEGELTRLRASLVCEPTLAFCAREFDLGELLSLGRGEELTGGRHRDSVTSDALEAVIGAIYMDGGFANAKEFIMRFILNDIEHKKLFFDSKTIFQEMVQGKIPGAISYHLIGEEGPDHDKIFKVEVWIGEKCQGEGSGRTKKAAEQMAAYHAICKLKQKVGDVCI